MTFYLYRKAQPEAVRRFKKALTQLGDVYVFEAFGAAHRYVDLFQKGSDFRFNIPFLVHMLV